MVEEDAVDGFLFVVCEVECLVVDLEGDAAVVEPVDAFNAVVLVFYSHKVVSADVIEDAADGFVFCFKTEACSELVGDAAFEIVALGVDAAGIS